MARPKNYCISCPFGGGPVQVKVETPGVTMVVNRETLLDVDDFIESLSGEHDSGPVPLEGWPSRNAGALDLRSAEMFVACEVLDAISNTVREWCES